MCVGWRLASVAVLHTHMPCGATEQEEFAGAAFLIDWLKSACTAMQPLDRTSCV
jgi:hypothetical protein